MNGVNISEVLYSRRISIPRWLKLMPSLPKGDFQQLCNLCVNYEKKKSRIKSSAMVMPADVQSIFTTVYQIMGEYKRLIRQSKPTAEDMKTLEQDITQTLSLWLEKGNLKNLVPLLTSHFNNGTLEDFAGQLLTHIDAFVYGRIFESLANALETEAASVRALFATDSLGKIGLTLKVQPSDEAKEDKETPKRGK